MRIFIFKYICYRIIMKIMLNMQAGWLALYSYSPKDISLRNLNSSEYENEK